MTKTTIGGIELFHKTFDPGVNCPQCGKPMKQLGTTNQWKYHCVPCKARFNEALEKFTG